MNNNTYYSYYHRRSLRKRTLIKNTILLGLSLLIWILCGIYLVLQREEHTLAMQQDLAEQVVRFHVLAASDSAHDQALKLLVKNAVLEYMSEPLNRCETASEALALLEEHTDDILRVARSVIAENGASYPVTAGIREVYFPVKSYGDITLPAGMYTAYQIIIGEGKGQNWWCVLYPPLCFIDITHGIVPEESKELLRTALTEEEYQAVTGQAGYSLLFDDEIAPDKVYLRFRILRFLNPDTDGT